MVEYKETNTSYTSHRRSITKKEIEKLVTKLKPPLDELKSTSEGNMRLQVTIKQIIKFMYDEFVCKPIVIEIIKRLIKGRSDSCIEHFMHKIDTIYETGFCLDGGLKDLKKHNNVLTKEEKSLIEEVIKRKNKLELIREVTGTDTAILINKKKKKIIREQTRYVNNKNHSKYYTIIEAYPKEVIVYDSPLTDEPRTFQIQWTSQLSSRSFKTGGEVGGGSILEIESQLENGGYCPNPRHLKGTISSIISAYIKHKIAVVKKNVEYPGFFYNEDTNGILQVNYNIPLPTKKKNKTINEALKEAVQVLEVLVKHFQGSEDKLATCLKWGWLSPFSFIKKQCGEFLPWLVMDGTAGTGKTILGQIILLLWQEVNERNDIGGSSFDTVARVGSRISQSTFPVLINEPHGTFQNGSVVDMLKSAVERTTARGKYINKRYTYIPSLAPLIFTTNQALPNLDAIVRRMFKITFHYNERKSDKQKKLFESEFMINSPTSPLTKLRYISKFFTDEIKADPELLRENWQDCANMILERLYTDLRIDMPKWLRAYTQNIGLEEFDTDQREDIRMFLIDQINKKSSQIKIYDEKGYPVYDESLYTDELKNYDDFRDRVWNVLNERLISWASLGVINHEKYVYLGQGLKKSLHNETEVCQSMRSLSELLGWKYQAVRLGNIGTPQKVIKVSFDEFISFLYPDFTKE